LGTGPKGSDRIHTNTAEGVFSVFKQGMKSVYQHCSEKHLHRYLAEFDFHYNARVALGVNDAARADRALRGVVGKRPTYGPSDEGEARWVVSPKLATLRARGRIRRSPSGLWRPLGRRV
jgi:hypothetical protein